MNESTKAMYAKILAEAQAKANAKSLLNTTTATGAQPAPKPAELPAAKPTPPPAPKMPTVKIYDNIQDLETAAENGQTVSILNMYELVNKKPVTPAPAAPELSTFTIDEIYNAPAIQEPEEVKPQPQPAPQTADKKVIGEFTFISYTAASFALQGPTYPVKDKMSDFGGKWNRHLKCGAGWIFPVKKFYIVRSFIEKLQATA